MKKKIKSQMLRCLFTIFALTISVNAQTPGDLDPNFFGGRVLSKLSGVTALSENVQATAVQSDGKIVVVGWGVIGLDGTSNDFFVARYNADGILDRTFGLGNNGWNYASFGGGFNDFARAVAIQPDGKIVVVGRTCANPCVTQQVAVARFNTDGSLDNNFSGDGKATATLSTLASGDAVAIQSDGKIVVGGNSNSIGGPGDIGNFALFRFNENGSLDSTFDGDGIVITDFLPGNPSSSSITSIAVQSDGKIVALGDNNVSGGLDFAVARYNSNGTLDTTFSGDGMVVTSIGVGTTDRSHALALHSNGKITVAGESSPGANYDVAVVQYNSDGTLDNTFGTNGIVTTPMSASGNDYGYAIAAQNDGKILVAGNFNDSSGRFVARYNTNGTLDSSYDGDGVNNVINFTQIDGSRTFVGLALQNDGKAVAVARASDIAIARFNTNGALDGTFGGRVISHSPNNEQIKSIAVQADGKIVAAGFLLNGTHYDFRVARYTPEGFLDMTFGSGGFVTINFGNTTGGVPLDDFAESVKIQADGKIVVTGSSNFAAPGANTFCQVARLNTNGTLDSSFSGDGLVRVQIGTNVPTHCYGSAIQNDGRIVISGRAGGALAVIRFNPNGSIESLPSTQANINAYGYDVVIQPDGKIVTGGTGASNFLTLIRYNANGSPDTTFGTNGVVSTTAPATGSSEFALAVQANGKIIAGFSSALIGSPDLDFRLVRFNANGSFDTSFGNMGSVMTDFGSNFDSLSQVGIQSNGKIVAVGTAPLGSNGEFAVARYNTNGSLDTTFDAGDGKVLTDVGGPSDTAYGAAIQPDGKIIAGGYTNGIGGANFALVRYGGTTGAPRRAPFDFDGDSKTDISVYRPSSGAWYIQNSGNNSFSSYAFGTAGDIITPGDYDGDGRDDVAVFRPSTGFWYMLRSSNGSFTGQQFGQSGDIPQPADYDGDGKTDVAVFRPSTSSFYALRSSNGSFLGVQFGAAGDVPVVSDYDGDGKADVAVYRPTGNFWFWLKSSNGEFDWRNFGLAGDLLAQGDYDGDGKTDVAVFRPSTGYWYVQGTLAGFMATAFGNSTDRPAPGDYDGDGKADYGVYRADSGSWYLLRSTAGFLGQQFGVNGDVPVPSANVP